LDPTKVDGFADGCTDLGDMGVRFADVFRGPRGYDVGGGITTFIAGVIKHTGEAATISTSDGTREIDEDVACTQDAGDPSE
jgi:hypothetical protein